MTEHEWRTASDSDVLLHYLIGTEELIGTGGGRLADSETCRTTGRKLRLYACGCYRMGNGIGFVDVVEKCVTCAEGLADERASMEDLEAALQPVRSRLKDREGKAPPDGSADRVEHLQIGNSLGLATVIAQDQAHRAAWYSRIYFDVDEVALVHEIFGNPFRPVAFDPNWRTSTAVAIAKRMYESRDFALMPLLADALQDAGCEHADILDHCRGSGPHVKGCWVVDLVLGKE